MRITRVANYQALSALAADIVIKEVQKKPDLLFCAATGGSPTGMYAEMQKEKDLFKQMRVIKMDEWGIIPSHHPDSCESYLQKHLLGPLNIPVERYVSFDPNTAESESEIQRIESYIQANSPMDICILGLGKNGHIAFNEPAAYLQAGFHKAILAESTIQHDPALSQGAEPAFGWCVGMQGILQTKKIIFLVTGKGKEAALQQILTQQITTDCPASFLWLHSNVELITDYPV
ncbi:6-phosphogluconolactonase [Aquirufa sp. TARAVU-A1A]